MTEVTSTIDITAIESELRPKSTDALKVRFFECYSEANFLAEAAVCVKLLKERGDNLDGMPMVATFLRVASGQILPELIWKFIDSPNRQRVERLPLDDQKRIASNPMVPVVEAKPEGGFTKRMVDLTKAPAEVARLVAGPEGIRSVEEQMKVIGSQKNRQSIISITTKDAPAQEPLSHQLKIKLTDSELESLRVALCSLV